MSREQEINDALALVADAWKNGELEEKFQGHVWRDADGGVLLCNPGYEYRAKPAPFELWVNIYPDNQKSWSHETPEEAERCAGKDRIRCAHMQEVVDE